MEYNGMILQLTQFMLLAVILGVSLNGVCCTKRALFLKKKKIGDLTTVNPIMLLPMLGVFLLLIENGSKNLVGMIQVRGHNAFFAFVSFNLNLKVKYIYSY